MHVLALAFVGPFLAAPLLAQTTWIVNAAGGPGVHFTSLPPAVAAAADGDTILVHAGPFGEGAAPFTTNKGLTIVGVGGNVPIASSHWYPFEVTNLPVSSTFRMAGFSWFLGKGELNFRIINCAGKVHLERLQADESDYIFPTWPSFEITGSPSVTLREIVNFGAPAVQISSSTVSLVSCQLGLTLIGICGGQAIVATNSNVDIVAPRFDTGFGPPSIPGAIETNNCALRVAGGPSSYIRHLYGPVIFAQGGTVAIDPAVVLVAGPVSPAIAGTATVTTATLPASWTTNATPGQVLTITSTAAPGSVLFQALGAAGFLIATPLGTLGIDAGLPFAFFPPAIVPAGGVVGHTLPVPAALTPGSAFATQSVVWNSTGLVLGLPATFVVD